MSPSASAASTSSRIQSASVASSTVGHGSGTLPAPVGERHAAVDRLRDSIGRSDGSTAFRRLAPPAPGGRVLEIQVESTDDYTLCRPSASSMPTPSTSSVRRSAGWPPRQRLLIDLSAVPFMDSAGLGALIGGIRRAREAGGDVAVACSRPTLTRLLHTTGFDRIVPGHRDRRGGGRRRSARARRVGERAASGLQGDRKRSVASFAQPH